MYVAVLPHIEYIAMLDIVYVTLMLHTTYCGCGSIALHFVGSILCICQYCPVQHNKYVTIATVKCIPYMQLLLNTMPVKQSQHIKL